MKILVHPQLSMRSYDTNTWLLSRDSQMNKLLGYFRNMPQHEWCVLIPDVDRCDDVTALKEAGVGALQVEWAENVQQARYTFDVDAMAADLGMKEPDILLLEVPELARNWRCVMDRNGRNIPIVSIINHADVFTWSKTFGKSGALLRQLDGAACSDAVVFHVHGTREAWLRAAYDVVTDYWMQENVLQKLTIWPGSFDLLEVPFGTKNEQDPLAVNFISRLSDNPRTHYLEFLEAIDLMGRGRVDFQAWLGDPNEAMMDSVPPFVTRQGPWSRRQYFDYLWQSSVVPILWPQWEMHSLGACHAIATENILVSPAPPDNRGMPGVVIKGEITGGKLAEAIKFALSLEGEARYEVIQSQHEWLRHSRSIQHNVHFAEETFQEVTRGV